MFRVSDLFDDGARLAPRHRCGRRLLSGEPHRHQHVQPCPCDRGSCACKLDRRCRSRDWMRHLGHAFHRDAGLRTRRLGRLQPRSDGAVAAGCRGRHRGGSQRRSVRPGTLGRASCGCDRRRRYRLHALYRHVGRRAAGPHHLGPGHRARFHPARDGIRRGSAICCDPGNRPAHHASRRAASHAGDRLAPFHGDGRGGDRSGSDARHHRVVAVADHARARSRKRGHRCARHEPDQCNRRPPAGRARAGALDRVGQHVPGALHVQREGTACRLQRPLQADVPHVARAGRPRLYRSRPHRDALRKWHLCRGFRAIHRQHRA